MDLLAEQKSTLKALFRSVSHDLRLHIVRTTRNWAFPLIMRA